MSNNPELQTKLRLLDHELQDGEITQKGKVDPMSYIASINWWIVMRSVVL
jgi:hypothetical protein